MIAWLNIACLVVVTALTAVFYVKSAGPAVLEQRIGPSAYGRCGRYRAVAMVCSIGSGRARSCRKECSEQSVYEQAL
jgi:hypothetical protein